MVDDAIRQRYTAMRDRVVELEAEIQTLRNDLAFYRQKVIEVQERNRKLDWVLTKVVEKL